MNTRNKQMKLSAIALAVASVLNAMPAHADDEEAAALTTRGSSVELGIANTDKDSAKFGEYNGLNKKGASLVGNVNIQGGDAYGSGGTSRWSITGSDLGLTSRTMDASFADQGKWNINLGFDQLQHNLSDSYQTPYVGSNGGNTFRLPTGFGLVPAAAAGTTTINLSAAQKAAFHNLDIDSRRQNTSLSAGLGLSPNLDIKFDFNHLEQTGAKLMGFGMNAVVPATVPSAAENVAVLPMPTKSATDTLNLALNWQNAKGHLTGGYFASFFREGYDRVNMQPFMGSTGMQLMTTLPSNQFHQLNLAGGYSLAAKTKLAANVSYGRNTQNEAFVVDPVMFVPGSTAAGNKLTSMNGLVVNTHADMKLTDQSIKDLTLTAGFRYDDRNNKSASNIYNFNAISGQHTLNAPNAPMSFRKDQIELAGDYRLAKRNSIRVAFVHEDMNRSCNQYAVNAGYPAGTNCVVATSHKDNKLDATYKMRAGDDLDFRVGYVYDVRKTDSDAKARAAFISTNGGGVAGAPAVGAAGLNAGDFVGFYPYFDASRTQHVGKLNVNWQANEKLSLTLGGRITQDNYDSLYGVKNGGSWSTNLDLTYAYSETGSIITYLSRQHRQRDMTDYQTIAAGAASATAISRPAGATWSNNLTDDDVSLGLGFKQAGLMGNKLELTGNLAYIVGKTNYNTVLNYTGATTTGATCASSNVLSCGALPEIRSATTQVKLGGTYQVDKKSKVALRYVYQRLNANDYYYNGYQTGFTPTTMLPTNQQVGNYTVNMIAVSYLYSF